MPGKVPAALLALFLLAPLAPAQEQPAVQVDPARQLAETPESRAEAMLAQIDVDTAKMRELREAIPGASGDERDLLNRQVQDEEYRLGGEIHALADLVLEVEQKGTDIGALKRKLLDYVRALPPAIVEALERRSAVLSDRVKERDAAEPDKLMEAEQRVTAASQAVDAVYKYYARQVALMDRLGLDATAVREDAILRIQERAERTATRVRLTADELRNVNTVLASAPDDATANKRLLLLTERQKSVVESLRLLVDQLKALGVDATEYQKLLVTVTGDIGAVGFDLAVLSGLATEALAKVGDWVRENGIGLVTRALVIALILLATWAAARGGRRLARKALQATSANVSQLLQDMLVGTIGNLIKLLGVLVALSQLGISVGPMLAGLGIAGFIVGFALQDTLSNFASGVMILFYRPFDVGDFIEAAGISGKVNDMNLVSTTVLTFDNQTLIVPNNKIWGDVIRNVTRQDKRRVDLVFGISYSDDIEHAERILQEIVAADKRVLDEPAPVIRLHELGESSVNYIVRPWVMTTDYWDVYWDITREVKRRFDAEGITIPFPQREVHHHNVQVATPATTAPGGPGA